MELAKIGKKGQLTIPRSILQQAGMPEAARVVVEATADGAIVLRQVAVYPLETYTDARVKEFEQANTLPVAMEKRVQAYLKAKRGKR